MTSGHRLHHIKSPSKPRPLVVSNHTPHQMNNIYAKHSSKRIKERKLRSTRFSVTVYLCFDLKRERMESDKRKMSEKEKNEERKSNNNNNNNSKKKKQKQHAIEKVTKEEKEATEEEVEEFFAILRRIQAAVDYFGGEGWRAAAEAAVVVDKGGDEDKEEEIVKVSEDINDGVLDLNAVPEADSQSH